MKHTTMHSMKQYILLLPVFILLAAAQFNPVLSQTSRGTEFWIGIPGNYDSDGLRELYITAEQASKVTVQNTLLGVNIVVDVAAGTLEKVTLPTSIQLTSNGVVENKGVNVTATTPVTVYSMSERYASTDAYLALPVDAIGKEYLVMGYTNVNLSGLFAQMAVVASEDNTTVTITPTASGGGFTAGISGNIVLNKGQSFQLRSSSSGSDYTGSTVVADKPVSVYGGNNCAFVPSNLYACDHLVQQMVPTSAWGQSFVTVPLATRLAGDVFRVMAQEDNTSVSLNGGSLATLNAGGFHEFDLASNSYNRITADKPILVGQFAKGTEADNVTGDPFFTLIPPDEQFLNNYVVSAGTANIPNNNYLNITSPTSNTGTVKVNEVTVAAGAWTAIPGTTFSGAQVPVSPGVHSITSNLPIGLLVYGFGFADSYGYLGGQAFGAVATVTSLTISPTTGSAQVGNERCWEAEVLDQFNDPVSGVRVDFDITGPNSGKSGFAFTDNNGIATFCYIGENPGTDDIDATVGQLLASATFTWTQQPVVVEGDAYCTYSQGFYGNAGGTDCDGRPTVVVINDALAALGGVTVGLNPGNYLEVDENEGSCVITRLPSGGPSIAISIGENLACTPVVLPGISTHATGPNAGRMRNTLVGQALALSLNFALNADLGGLELPAGYDYMVTAKADGCYDPEAEPIPNTEQYYYMPQSVTDYLNGSNGYSGAVQGLLDLANDALSGVTLAGTPPSMGDITAALEAINDGFVDCRVLIGWEEASAKRMDNVVWKGMDISVFPNPSTTETTFMFSVTEKGNVSLEIFNNVGARIEVLFSGVLEANEVYSIAMPVAHLAAGIYHYRFTAGSESKSGSLVIAR